MTTPVPPGPLGRRYWAFWASSAASNLADGVLKVALPLVALGYTRSPALIAGLAAAASLPWLLAALPAGALVDRLDRRRVMLGANAVRVLLLALLVAATALELSSIWLLYVVAFGVGLTETMYDTSAQSLLPQVVHRDQLSRANSRLYAAELTANQFVGPPLGGLLLALGALAAFGAPALLWLLAVGALLMVRGSYRVERTVRTTLRADVAEGLRYLWGHDVLRTLAVLTGLSNLVGAAVGAVFVLFAVGPESPMGLTEPGYGLLLTATAGGAVFGTFVAERLERALGRTRALTLALLAGAGMAGAPALTANVWVIGAVNVVGGVTIVLWNVIVVSLRQRMAPPRLLGRLNSAYRLLAWGTLPIGAAIGGVLAEAYGLRVVFAVMAVVSLLLVPLMLTLTDDRIAAADHPG